MILPTLPIDLGVLPLDIRVHMYEYADLQSATRWDDPLVPWERTLIIAG